MRRDVFHPTRALALIFGLILAAADPTLAHDDGEPGRFLVISDIHFDPFYDGALFPRLAAAPAEQWGAILRGSQPPGLNPRGADSNDALLQSSLDDARARCPRPAFVLYPGDFMAHEWQKRYDKLAPRGHLQDPDAYRAFTDKAIAYVAEEFRRRWPDTPILPTLGNDDSYCGDYMIEPQGPFLAMFARTWEPLLHADAAYAVAFRETFPRGGYYTLPLPGVKGHRLVVLNTVPFSVSYDNACGSPTQTPALDQLAWLDRTLGAARDAGESAWLLLHIPPGINGYNSAEDVPKGGAPDTFWQPELTARFLQVLARHRETLRFGLAGHTHMDDFRVVRLDDEPVLLLKIAPAVSPIFGNNPGYGVYQFDRDTGAVRTYETFHVPDLAGAGGPPTPPPARWSSEYDFRTAYDLPDLSARSVARLADRLATDALAQQRYTAFYGVSAPPEFTPAQLPVYRCAIANVTPAEFLASLTGGSKPNAPHPHPHPDRERAPRPAAAP